MAKITSGGHWAAAPPARQFLHGVESAEHTVSKENSEKYSMSEESSENSGVEKKKLGCWERGGKSETNGKLPAPKSCLALRRRQSDPYATVLTSKPSYSPKLTTSGEKRHCFPKQRWLGVTVPQITHKCLFGEISFPQTVNIFSHEDNTAFILERFGFFFSCTTVRPLCPLFSHEGLEFTLS